MALIVHAQFARIADDVVLGPNVEIFGLVNMYGCVIGEGTRIGAFVEIQRGVRVGARCKVSSHAFLCEGVTIEDEVFIGHHVCFTNDLFPRATRPDGVLQSGGDWQVTRTTIRRGASLGSGAVILAGVTVGECALVGAGAVVTRDVDDYTVVVGNPARVVRRIERESSR